MDSKSAKLSSSSSTGDVGRSRCRSPCEASPISATHILDSPTLLEALNVYKVTNNDRDVIQVGTGGAAMSAAECRVVFSNHHNTVLLEDDFGDYDDIVNIDDQPSQSRGRMISSVRDFEWIGAFEEDVATNRTNTTLVAALGPDGDTCTGAAAYDANNFNISGAYQNTYDDNALYYDDGVEYDTENMNVYNNSNHYETYYPHKQHNSYRDQLRLKRRGLYMATPHGTPSADRTDSNMYYRMYKSHTLSSESGFSREPVSSAVLPLVGSDVHSATTLPSTIDPLAASGMSPLLPAADGSSAGGAAQRGADTGAARGAAVSESELNTIDNVWAALTKDTCRFNIPLSRLQIFTTTPVAKTYDTYSVHPTSTPTAPHTIEMDLLSNPSALWRPEEHLGRNYSPHPTAGGPRAQRAVGGTALHSTAAEGSDVCPAGDLQHAAAHALPPSTTVRRRSRVSEDGSGSRSGLLGHMQRLSSRLRSTAAACAGHKCDAPFDNDNTSRCVPPFDKSSALPHDSENPPVKIKLNERACYYTIAPLHIDPAMRSIPLRGKVVCTYGLIFATTFIFLTSIVLEGGFVPLSINPMLGPGSDVLISLGGLTTAAVRSGEWWRLFWAPYLHSGVFHLLMNLLSLERLGVLIEPDWGAWRFFTIFTVGGFSGCMLSATLDPYHVSVGSSGGLFGLLAAFIPYIIEYWSTIAKPGAMTIVAVASLFVGIACGFVPHVDNYAHLGGALGGLLAGFATLSKIDCPLWRTEPLSEPQTDFSKNKNLNRQMRYTRHAVLQARANGAVRGFKFAINRQPQRHVPNVVQCRPAIADAQRTHDVGDRTRLENAFISGAGDHCASQFASTRLQRGCTADTGATQQRVKWEMHHRVVGYIGATQVVAAIPMQLPKTKPKAKFHDGLDDGTTGGCMSRDGNSPEVESLLLREYLQHQSAVQTTTNASATTTSSHNQQQLTTTASSDIESSGSSDRASILPRDSAVGSAADALPHAADGYSPPTAPATTVASGCTAHSSCSTQPLDTTNRIYDKPPPAVHQNEPLHKKEVFEIDAHRRNHMSVPTTGRPEFVRYTGGSKHPVTGICSQARSSSGSRCRVTMSQGGGYSALLQGECDTVQRNPSRVEKTVSASGDRSLRLKRLTTSPRHYAAANDKYCRRHFYTHVPVSDARHDNGHLPVAAEAPYHGFVPKHVVVPRPSFGSVVKTQQHLLQQDVKPDSARGKVDTFGTFGCLQPVEHVPVVSMGDMPRGRRRRSSCDAEAAVPCGAAAGGAPHYFNGSAGRGGRYVQRSGEGAVQGCAPHNRAYGSIGVQSCRGVAEHGTPPVGAAAVQLGMQCRPLVDTHTTINMIDATQGHVDATGGSCPKTLSVPVVLTSMFTVPATIFINMLRKGGEAMSEGVIRLKQLWALKGDHSVTLEHTTGNEETACNTNSNINGGSVRMRRSSDANAHSVVGAIRTTPSKRSVFWKAIKGVFRPRMLHSRFSVRATISPVADSNKWRCGCQIWTVRLVAALCLVVYWATLSFYLFICPSCYEAPGQVVK